MMIMMTEKSYVTDVPDNHNAEIRVKTVLHIVNLILHSK